MRPDDVGRQAIELVEKIESIRTMDSEARAECVLLIRDALAAPRLTWTTEKPSKVGWYWWRSKGDVQILSLYECDSLLRAEGIDIHWGVETLEGEWAGPIVPPEEKA